MFSQVCHLFFHLSCEQCALLTKMPLHPGNTSVRVVVKNAVLQTLILNGIQTRDKSIYPICVLIYSLFVFSIVVRKAMSNTSQYKYRLTRCCVVFTKAEIILLRCKPFGL